MANDPGTERLRKVYATLLERRALEHAAPEIPVEEIHALAEGTYSGADRTEKLDAVLADARTAAEFHFFLDLVLDKPRAPARLPSWLAAAASALLVLTAAVFWRIARSAPDPVRSQEDITLAAPQAGATVARTERFIWRAVENAAEYRFELIDEEANTVYAVTTADTMLMLPQNVQPVAGLPHLWWITARLRDGTDARSLSRPVQFRELQEPR